ncbi:hypothetical protein HYT02_03980 [Candidatus Gottesmanbacteria bacterium]|nr:hypothetical protein [Candidatus Gottesmanbacteria bacterium]
MDPKIPAQQLPPVPVSPSSPPTNSKKNITLLIIVLFTIGLFVISVVVLYVVKTNTDLQTQNNTVELPTPTSQKAEVELQSKYENPFDENSQYVNPFSENKNPFDNLQ